MPGPCVWGRSSVYWKGGGRHCDAPADGVLIGSYLFSLSYSASHFSSISLAGSDTAMATAAL